MTLNPRHFKGLGKEPGEQSPPESVDPEVYCEERGCEFLSYDGDEWKCLEGRDPQDCINEAIIDEDEKGDMEYHRKVDEGEL